VLEVALIDPSVARLLKAFQSIPSARLNTAKKIEKVYGQLKAGEPFIIYETFDG